MIRKLSKTRIFGISLALLFFLYVAGVVPPVDSRLTPSGFSAYVPDAEDTFEFYIEQNRQRIRAALAENFYDDDPAPFGEGYGLEEVVEMRAPFQIPIDGQVCNDARSGAGKGFLLVHGLTDSPYLLKALANELSEFYPCALIRGLLTPGHGTVPGDLLQVTREEWEAVTAFGVEGFPDGIEELYLVGYSNGSSMLLNYLAAHRDNRDIKGLILLSPGLKTNQELTYLAPYARYLMRWAYTGEDRDAVKYESLAMNSVAVFYSLTSEVTSPDFIPVDLPVFMAMSSDDTTVDNSAAVEFFCNKVDNDQRRLLWYRSTATALDPDSNCTGLQVIDVDVASPRFVNHSHVAITMPPNDPHYGVDGNHPVCLAYNEDPVRFADCRTNNEATVYGENNIRGEDGLYQGKLVRRATFNPLFNEMMSDITCFIDREC